MSKRTTLILVILVFVAPVLASIYLNSQFSDFVPQATKNHGRLLSPPMPASGALADWLGERPADRWSLVLRCNQDCAERADLGARLKKTTGRDSGRLEWRTLGPDAAVSVAELAAVGLASDEQAFIVDPAGLIVMAYAGEADATGIRKDLATLLKHSRNN